MRRRSRSSSIARRFNGEAGGQVGDTGSLNGEGCEFDVIDTQRDGGLILHLGHLKRGPAGDRPSAQCQSRRAPPGRHPPGTLGDSPVAPRVAQRRWATPPRSAGRKSRRTSSVLTSRTSGRCLRRRSSRSRMRSMRASRRVRPYATNVMRLEDAKKRGAMALFGEKISRSRSRRRHGGVQHRALRRHASYEHRPGRILQNRLGGAGGQRRAARRRDDRPAGASAHPRHRETCSRSWSLS